MPEKCHVIGCDKAAVANGLCSTHYKRVARHGDVNAGRSDDWGKREIHPAYKPWCNLRRYHRQNMDQSWVDDFWNFVKDIPEFDSNAKAHRPDKSKPWSKTNFYWKVSRVSSDNYKEYMREWHKKSRAANPDYYQDQDLKKNYGVTLGWYRATLEKQNGACAICKKPETAVIRGKLLKLAVDHCHDTGKVRGLLCRACNNAIGALNHDVDVLQAAIKYLSD